MRVLYGDVANWWITLKHGRDLFLGSALMRSDPLRRTAAPLPPQPDAQSIARRIRNLRHERGWSLADVEKLSRGSIKAAVLGSYERCDRTMNLNRAIELAHLFSVPLAHLLSAPEHITIPGQLPLIMIDLRRVKSLDQGDPITPTFTVFISWIAGKRCDWNGEVMSLRKEDLSTLALMTLSDEAGFLEWLRSNRLLITGLITGRDRP